MTFRTDDPTRMHARVTALAIALALVVPVAGEAHQPETIVVGGGGKTQPLPLPSIAACTSPTDWSTDAQFIAATHAVEACKVPARKKAALEALHAALIASERLPTWELGKNIREHRALFPDRVQVTLLRSWTARLASATIANTHPTWPVTAAEAPSRQHEMGQAAQQFGRRAGPWWSAFFQFVHIHEPTTPTYTWDERGDSALADFGAEATYGWAARSAWAARTRTAMTPEARFETATLYEGVVKSMASESLPWSLQEDVNFDAARKHLDDRMNLYIDQSVLALSGCAPEIQDVPSWMKGGFTGPGPLQDRVKGERMLTDVFCKDERSTYQGVTPLSRCNEFAYRAAHAFPDMVPNIRAARDGLFDTLTARCAGGDLDTCRALADEFVARQSSNAFGFGQCTLAPGVPLERPDDGKRVLTAFHAWCATDPRSMCDGIATEPVVPGGPLAIDPALRAMSGELAYVATLPPPERTGPEVDAANKVADQLIPLLQAAIAKRGPDRLTRGCTVRDYDHSLAFPTHGDHVRNDTDRGVTFTHCTPMPLFAENTQRWRVGWQCSGWQVPPHTQLLAHDDIVLGQDARGQSVADPSTGVPLSFLESVQDSKEHLYGLLQVQNASTARIQRLVDLMNQASHYCQ
jgi:hypothetical protein